MKVIAKVGFSGPAVSMSIGQVGEIADKTVLADLLKAGYVEKVEEMPEGEKVEEMPEGEKPGEAEKTLKEPVQEIAPAQKQKKKKAVKSSEGK